MHRQTDRKTDRQKQTDHNNPLLSSSVNKDINYISQHVHFDFVVPHDICDLLRHNT